MIKITIESDQAIRSINIDFESGSVTTDPLSAGTRVTQSEDKVSAPEFTSEHPVLHDEWEEEMVLPSDRAERVEGVETGETVPSKRPSVGERLNVDVSSIKPKESAVPPTIEIPDTTNRAASSECGIENEEL
ncbi:conserved hypothetical protein [Vibrio phage 150E35-1]|nr:conserved hypothetical protein [Vibrio phage 150E35-1]